MQSRLLKRPAVIAALDLFPNDFTLRKGNASVRAVISKSENFARLSATQNHRVFADLAMD